MDGRLTDRLARGARWRALGAVGLMAVGYTLAREWIPGVGIAVHSGAWFGVALLALAAALGTRGRVCTAAMGATVLALSAGWFTFRIHEGPGDRLVLPVEPEEVVICVEGVVVEGAHVPVARGALARFAIHSPSHRFTLDVRRVRVGEAAGGDGGDWRPVSGRLVVHVDADGAGRLEAPAGRRVRVTGRASAAGGPTNPGQADHRLWSAQSGVVGSMSVPSPALVESGSFEPVVFEPVLRALQHGREWLTSRARAGIESIEHPRARALVASLMLGAEEEHGREVATQFQRLGLAHVLAISGVHIAVLAWATTLLVRLCGDFGALEPVLAATAVVLYLVVVPGEAPVVRSGVMVLALLVGEAMGRRYDGVAILGWTAAALLIVRPMDLWSLGFQLSFGVTGVLIGAGPAFHARMWGTRSPLADTSRDPTMAARLATGAGKAISASVLAWAVATPWIAARVGLFSPLAPVSSLVAGVAVSGLMMVGFLCLLLGTLVPGLSAVWGLTEPVARVALWCVDMLDGLPGSSMATGSIPLAWGGVASVAVLWLLVPGRRGGAMVRTPADEEGGGQGQDEAGGSRGGSRSWLGARPWVARIGVIVGLGLWLAYAMTFGRSLGPGVALRVDTLDVGDATCHLIRSGDEALLWDCGSSWAGAGEVQIPGAIRSLGVPPVRTAVVTHANFDHFNTLPDAAWRLGVRRVLVSPLLIEQARQSPRGATAAMLELLRSHGIEVREVEQGFRMRLGEATVELLWPEAGVARGWTVNDQSLVARVCVSTESGARVVLMTGDVQARAIASLLPGPGDEGAVDQRVRADVLEAPHHGAYTEAAAALVDAAGATVVIQSTGRTSQGLGRANDPGWNQSREAADWLITARDGAAFVELKRDGTIRGGATRRSAAWGH